jgi:hypothetical protein
MQEVSKKLEPLSELPSLCSEAVTNKIEEITKKLDNPQVYFYIVIKNHYVEQILLHISIYISKCIGVDIIRINIIKVDIIKIE